LVKEDDESYDDIENSDEDSDFPAHPKRRLQRRKSSSSFCIGYDGGHRRKSSFSLDDNFLSLATTEESVLQN
jgi:hypothetical protein